jgi:hypothetical protein
MNYNQPNLIVDKIFTDTEVEEIYRHIDSTPEDRQQLMELFSHKAYHNWLPEGIVKTITASAQSTTDKKIVLGELSFARYAKFDERLPVQLPPHWDEAFREPRLTFDIQLKSNRDWPIVVEGREYTLKDNQALTFSGTNQVHWRTKTDFAEGDFVDMVFAHFYAEDAVKEELGPNPLVFKDGKYSLDMTVVGEHDILMLDKRAYWENVYKESK